MAAAFATVRAMSASTGAEFTIDPVSLRARPVDPVAMTRIAEDLRAQTRSAPDAIEGARLASRAAILFGMLDRHDEARVLFDWALARQKAVAQRYDRTVTEIRLAQLLQFSGQLAEAEVLLEALIARCRAEPALEPLLDFALQHQGKVHFDQSAYARALACFEEALDLRRDRNQPELVASTETAIAATRRRLESDAPMAAGSAGASAS